MVEPFCGDGRLICWLLEFLAAEWDKSPRRVHVDLWDCDADAVAFAKRRVEAVGRQLGIRVVVAADPGDTFTRAPEYFGQYHLCVTNPPWENLKPDRRELDSLTEEKAGEHVDGLRQRDALLAQLYPLSQPLKKFSGWGTNLARCGTEAAIRLVSPGGAAGVVSPSSLLADQMSYGLRTWLFRENRVVDIAYFVAEARLFDKVDQPSVTLVVAPGEGTTIPPALAVYDRNHQRSDTTVTAADWFQIGRNAYVFPLQFGIDLIGLGAKYASLPRFADLERDGLWAGREIDETNLEESLAASGSHLFVKGRMVNRFGLAEQPDRFIKTDGPKVPKSAAFHRVVWRDVSRPNQKRRVHATLIPPGWVTGNSLHVAYFQDEDLPRLKALLAVMNSLVFESQARSHLATAHVSLGVVRRVHIPDLSAQSAVSDLAALADRCLSGDLKAANEAEVSVARLYGLNRTDFERIVASFQKLDENETRNLLAAWDAAAPPAVLQQEGAVMIPNHYASPLSEMDLQMVRAVPPGGNWKSIPVSVPSKRLEQIRTSFAAGEGSRSTYYGRLHPDAPAYTINTYFTRPGNGCHAHYDFEGGQHRTLSQREAARLQSFPDAFVFQGSRGAINDQIGNAVPPLLAYQIATTLPFRGRYVDLFCGAGGLGLGFLWAGWRPVVANDVEKYYLQTYRANVHDSAVLGSIRDQSVFDEVIARCEADTREHPNEPLFVLGGPPCQGFSTAGNKRSLEDERNWLFRPYKEVIERLRPAGFVFENVTGLLSMEKGQVFETIQNELRPLAECLRVMQLRAELYGVPQRRTRVIILGGKAWELPPGPPAQLTQMPAAQIALFGGLPDAVTVRQALSDLPSLVPGEDGSAKEYVGPPSNAYQQLMRGAITAAQYVAALGGVIPNPPRPETPRRPPPESHPRRPRGRTARPST